LDIKLRFSDNTWIKLDEIDRENYILGVDSLEPSVVELPPIQNSKYPRIIAVSEGGGPIMRSVFVFIQSFSLIYLVFIRKDSFALCFSIRRWTIR